MRTQSDRHDALSVLSDLPNRIGRAAILVLLVIACADSVRDNPVDPANSPAIELREPVAENGAVVIRFRYWSEASAAVNLVIRKVAQPQGDQFPHDASNEIVLMETEQSIQTVAQFPVPPISSGWQTLTARDEELVAGARILYQVAAVDADGGIISAASRSFRLEGTQFELIEVDPGNVAIRFQWQNVPAGTIGFQIDRTPVDRPTDTVFTSADPSVASFTDTTPSGNTVYGYRLVTLLASGGEIVSDEVVAGLYALSYTTDMDPTSDPGKRAFLTGFGEVAVSTIVGDNGVRTAQTIASEGTVTRQFTLDMTGYRTESFSMTEPSGSLFAFRYLSGGISSDGSRAFVSGWQDTSTAGNRVPRFIEREVSWPASGGSRTGIQPFFSNILFYEGTTIRVLDGDLNVIEEGVIPDGEPLEIHYRDQTIWLAYPDRVLRSASTTTWAGAAPWTETTLPAGVTLTAMTFTFGNIAVLDAPAAKLRLLDTEGNLLLDWDAPGILLENGAIKGQGESLGNANLIQMDGDGTVYYFQPSRNQ